MNLSHQYIENMKKLLGDIEYIRYEESLLKPSFNGLRLNPLKVNNSEILKKFPSTLSPVPWCEGGWYYNDFRPSKHPYYNAGLYYLQEPSAMLPGALLPIEQNDNVLDMCAAPGGKATQLAGKLNNTGILFANDISAGRTKALLKNIELFGIQNAIVLSENPKKLSERLPEFFDKILIDAPCSGEGMFRREPGMIKEWGDELLEFCQNQQRQVLIEGAKLLKPGGMLLYSTCTFSPNENEAMILEFLENHKDFKIVPIKKDWGFKDGIVINGNENLKGCVRLYPQNIDGEGHFAALLQREQNNSAKNTFTAETQDTDVRLEYYYSFCKEVLNKTPEGIFKVYGDTLCVLPTGTPSLKGLRVLRSGWQLGVFKKNRFEPSQPFAMGLRRCDVKKAIDLAIDDENVLRYLKGETIQTDPTLSGWHILFTDSYPLGFGKAQAGRLKNKYSTSWRWE